LKGEARALSEYDALGRASGYDAADPGTFARWARSVGGEVDSTLGTNFGDIADQTEASIDHPERNEAHLKLRYAFDPR